MSTAPAPNPYSHPQPFDGDTQFTRGMNSQIDPMSIPAGFYRASMNSVNRGGLVQCRPGYDWKFNMPDGKLQGAFLFTPSNDVEQLLFAIDGKVYCSSYPFEEFTVLSNLTFRNNVDNIYFCQAEKAVQTQPDGTIKLITPYRLVVIQDGFTPPGAWDGSTDQHITDPSDTPIGTAMAWSGDRLWVARRQELFAGDINDPLSFREEAYISLAKSFLLDKPITALAEVTSNATVQLLAFTENSTTAFQSSIRTRANWESTQQFQALVFPNVGCVSHRSVVTLNGLLWWYSRFGLTNLNTAVATYGTSEFHYSDLEMAASKAFLYKDLSKVACAVYENYFLASVPYADVYNTHTWVMDKGPAETLNNDSPDAWNSYWTGTRPAEWATGFIQGVNRIFQFSIDYDGVNRCWEAFSSSRTDNGCPITWTLETRAYNGNNVAQKEIRWMQIFLAELEGTVDVAVYWNGTSKGAFKRCLTKRIVAQQGVIVPGRQYTPDTQVYSLKKQFRTLVTTDIKTSPLTKTSCQIESDQQERIDTGFQFLIVVSGPGAIRGTRVFASNAPDVLSGSCEKDEDEEINLVRFDGEGADNFDDLDEDLEEFSATASDTFTYQEEDFSGSGEAVSIISEKDSQKVADCQAHNQINIWQSWVLPDYVGAGITQ